MEKMRQLDKKAFFRGASLRRENKAQTVLEYAAIIMCVVLALLAMQVYMKRGMQGRLRQLGDELGQQYAPGNTTGTSSITYYSNSTTTVETLNEQDLNLDLDGDDNRERNVFGTLTESTLDEGRTTQRLNETVGELESSLY